MPEIRRRHLLKLTGIGCVGIPLLVLLLSFLIVKYQLDEINSQLPEHMAKLKAMGVPLESNELVPSPPIPTADNGADLLVGVIGGFTKEKAAPYYRLGEIQLKKLSDTPGATIERDPAIVAMLSKLEPLLSRLDGIAKYTRFYVEPGKLPRAYGDQLKNLREFYELAEVTAYRSQLAANTGDYAKSLTAIRNLLAIVHLLNGDISQDSTTSSVNIHSLAFSSLNNYLQKAQNNPAALNAVRETMEAFPETIDVRKSLFADIVQHRKEIRNMRSLGELDPFLTNPRAKTSLLDYAVEYSDVRTMYESLYLGLWSKFFDRMGQDGRDWTAAYVAGLEVEKELKAPESTTNRVNKKLVPILKEVALGAGRLQARNRLALLATRILQDRPHGLPMDLKIYGSLAVDPMSGQLMGYAHKGGGFKVWSVGRDLIDNGGAELDRARSGIPGGYDEVLNFNYSEPRPIPQNALSETP